MKKSIIIIILVILILPIVVNAESKYLYDVLKDEAESGGLAREYTREHQDTVDNSGTDKIYHYYAETDLEANQIKNKRNVIFGGFCWQMFRTTDSGGVKMIYNGFPENGTCIDNNPNIGPANYATYSDSSYNAIGSAGYMHNYLNTFHNYYKPTSYGEYIQNGTALTEDEYIVVENKESIPFTFSISNGWQNGTVNNYANDSYISFKVKTAGSYLLDYDFFQDGSSDWINVYKNGKRINNIYKTQAAIIPLGELTTDDVIKVELDLIASYNRSRLKFHLKKPTGTATDTRPYFGNDVDYINGIYYLKNTIRSDGTNNLSYNHYYCINGSLSCSEVYYALSWGGSSNMSSYKLSGENNIEDFVNRQLYADNVNTYDSDLKAKIDLWYENNLINYQKYLEDTVFCQNKKLAYENNTLNPNGGNESLEFHKYKYSYSYSSEEERESDKLYNTNLKCYYETDKYSISNEKAKLKYPVATINLAESMLLSKTKESEDGGKVRGFTNGGEYWLLSPYSIGGATYGWSVSSTGRMSYSYGSNTNYARPVISLKKGIEIKSGDGSVSNPYIIKEYHNINIEIINETEDITVSINNLNQSYDNEPVNFKITPIKGYKVKNVRIVDKNNNEIEYTTTDNKNFVFTMPSSNVTIIPSYERVKSAINVEDNKNTKEFVIEVNDATAVVYEDTVRFKLQPEEGYEVEDIEIIDEEHNKISYRKTSNMNEFEFTMPDTNVIIKPKYRKIDSSELINPNTKSQVIFVIIALIILGIITTIYIVKKKRLN